MLQPSPLRAEPSSLFPDPDRARRYVGLLLYCVGTAAGFAFLALIFLLPPVFEEQVLPVYHAMGIGALLALPAGAMYLTVPRLLDRYDPEPLYALVGSLCWGALAACGFSALINSTVELLVGELFGPDVGETISAVVSAPIVEEGFKGLGVFGIYFFLRREFDGTVDGVIYATFIALGFATTENIVYYAKAAMEGTDILAGTVFVRGFVSPWVHPTFTALTGLGFGIARETRSSHLRFIAPALGYGAACVLHFVWNGSLALSDVLAMVMLPLWGLFVAGFLALVIGLVVRRGRIIRDHLVDEVAIGTIDHAELELVASAFGLFRARMRHGKMGEAFVRAVARLALSKWHSQRAARGKHHTISMDFIVPLRKRIRKLKAHAPATARNQPALDRQTPPTG